MSSIPWGSIDAIGRMLVVVTVAPFLIGMVWVISNMGMNPESSELIIPLVELFVGGMMTLVPLTLGGIFLYAIFQIAAEHA